MPLLPWGPRNDLVSVGSLAAKLPCFGLIQEANKASPRRDTVTSSTEMESEGPSQTSREAGVALLPSPTCSLFLPSTCLQPTATYNPLPGRNQFSSPPPQRGSSVTLQRN